MSQSQGSSGGSAPHGTRVQTGPTAQRRPRRTPSSVGCARRPVAARAPGPQTSRGPFLASRACSPAAALQAGSAPCTRPSPPDSPLAAQARQRQAVARVPLRGNAQGSCVAHAAGLTLPCFPTRRCSHRQALPQRQYHPLPSLKGRTFTCAPLPGQSPGSGLGSSEAVRRNWSAIRSKMKRLAQSWSPSSMPRQGPTQYDHCPSTASAWPPARGAPVESPQALEIMLGLHACRSRDVNYHTDHTKWRESAGTQPPSARSLQETHQVFPTLQTANSATLTPAEQPAAAQKGRYLICVCPRACTRAGARLQSPARRLRWRRTRCTPLMCSTMLRTPLQAPRARLCQVPHSL